MPANAWFFLVGLGRIGSEWNLDAVPDSFVLKLSQQEASAIRPAGLHDSVKRVHPLLRLGRVIIAIRVNRHSILGRSMTPGIVSACVSRPVGNSVAGILAVR